MALTGAALLGAGLAFGRSDAVFGAVTLIAAVCGSWLAARVRGLPVVFRRTMPSAIVARRRPVTVRLGVAQWRGGAGIPDLAALAGEVREATPWGELAPGIEQWGSALGYAVAPPQRGVFQLGPARLSLLGPLGLVQVTFVVSGTEELVVAPALVPVAAPWPDPDLDRQQVRSAAGAERVTDPTSVRDYRSGDPRRLVHWKATARRDRLMVRDTVTRALPDVWVLVDDAAEAGEAAEKGLEIAASLAVRLLRRRHTVHLVELSGSRPPRRFVPEGGREPVLEYFARLELVDDRSGGGGGGGAGAGAGAGGAGGGAGGGGGSGGGGGGGGAGGGAGAGAGGGDWVARLVGELGARGATGPVYGAVERYEAALVRQLSQASVLADPAYLYLAGRAALHPADFVTAGWQVAQAGSVPGIAP
jgi:uncharacterized protein (DUF58 family)